MATRSTRWKRGIAIFLLKIQLDCHVTHSTKQRNQSKPSFWPPPDDTIADTDPVRLTREKCTHTGNPMRELFQTISQLIDGGAGAQKSCTKMCTRLPHVLLLVKRRAPTSAVQAARHPLKPELVRSPKLEPSADGARTPIRRHPSTIQQSFHLFRSRLRLPTRERSVQCEHQPQLFVVCGPTGASSPLSFCTRNLSAGSCRYLHGSPFRSNQHLRREAQLKYESGAESSSFRACLTACPPC